MSQFRRPVGEPASTSAQRWVRRPATALIVGLVLAMLAVAPTAAGASSTWLDAEQRLTDLVNEERASRGLPPMQVSLQMVRIARDWSETMADEDRLYHRPHLDAQVFGPWERLAENVGYVSHGSTAALEDSIDRLHQAFMDSAGHRVNVLGDYNQVGVGMVLSSNGRLWATLNFLRGPLGEFPLFEDIGGIAHEINVERAWMGDLAQGCEFARYCPSGSVNRAQMATFIARALQLSPVASDRFTDVDPGSPHAGAINALVDAGVAAGCATDRFCPTRPVNRAQMATFLAKALELEPSNVPAFIDVPLTSPHFGYVNAVAQEAIAAGCDAASLRYCPDDPVRRDQMATFLARAFETPPASWRVSAGNGGSLLSSDGYVGVLGS